MPRIRSDSSPRRSHKIGSLPATLGLVLLCSLALAGLIYWRTFHGKNQELRAPSGAAGVSMAYSIELKESEYPSDVKEISAILYNHTAGDLTTDTNFIVEKSTEDGWYILMPQNQLDQEAEKLKVPAQGKANFPCDLSGYYLTKGEYRVVKELEGELVASKSFVCK